MYKIFQLWHGCCWSQLYDPWCHISPRLQHCFNSTAADFIIIIPFSQRTGWLRHNIHGMNSKYLLSTNWFEVREKYDLPWSMVSMLRGWPCELWWTDRRLTAWHPPATPPPAGCPSRTGWWWCGCSISDRTLGPRLRWCRLIPWWIEADCLNKHCFT